MVFLNAGATNWREGEDLRDASPNTLVVADASGRVGQVVMTAAPCPWTS
jgi:hypothetical protein